MKTISLAVSEVEYEAFRQAAKVENRAVAQLIREAMAYCC
jgi:HJR/Mrr/RecB family endonuclease